MNIIVLVKQVPNPEIPPDKFRIDPTAKKVVPPEGIPPVINPFDEQAVELALRLKETHGGKITILTQGSGASSTVVRHALSLGADEGIILADEAFQGSDSFATAYILTRAIQKMGVYDLILCGRQAADWDEGLVGSLIAENLDLPVVTRAKSVEVTAEGLIVKRTTLDGYQTFLVPAPAVITVGNEVGRPRLPSGWGIISAARKQIPLWTARDIEADLSLVGAAPARRKLLKLLVPARERRCEIVPGNSAAEAAAKLADRLRQAGII